VPDGQVDLSASRLNREIHAWRRSATPAARKVFGRRMKVNLPGSHRLRQFVPSIPNGFSLFCSIEPAPCLLDGCAVLLGPKAKTADGFEQGMS
jgi:hypothetical protein